MSSVRIDLAHNGRWRVEILNADKEVIAFCWANELFDIPIIVWLLFKQPPFNGHTHCVTAKLKFCTPQSGPWRKTN